MLEEALNDLAAVDVDAASPTRGEQLGCLFDAAGNGDAFVVAILQVGAENDGGFVVGQLPKVRIFS